MANGLLSLLVSAELTRCTSWQKTLTVLIWLQNAAISESRFNTQPRPPAAFVAGTFTTANNQGPKR
jgi:hypothetical protein